MSRSYRHNPCLIGAYNHRQFVKRQAAKVVRKLSIDEEVGNNRDYRRRFPQYDMRDYSFYVCGAKSRLFRYSRPGSFEPIHDYRREFMEVRKYTF